MKYRSKSFTVAASESDGSMCTEKGHSAPDSKGKCMCCGQLVRRVDPTPVVAVETHSPYIEILEGPRAGEIVSAAEAETVSGIKWLVLEGERFDIVYVEKGLIRVTPAARPTPTPAVAS